MPGNRTERRGRGPTPRRVQLTPTAARELRLRTTGAFNGQPYSAEIAGAAASAILEALAAHRLVYLSDDMRAALPWLETARAQCFHETAQRGLDSLIAALWVAQNKLR